VITDQTLSSAIERGILSPEQVAQLNTLVRTAPVPDVTEPEDEEKFRFITGFSDIFVTMGLALFTGALGYFVYKIVGAAAMWGALAVVTWALAEFFTRRRRMALPSIALLTLFAVAVLCGASVVLNGLAGTGEFLDFDTPIVLTGSTFAAVAAAALHYLRFRVPITIAVGTAALAGVVFGILLAIDSAFVVRYGRSIVFVLGLAVFALAMRFDLSDPERATRRTDIAFWLHLLAAPLIVNPLVGGFGNGGLDKTAAIAILAIFAALGLVALVIDRRAILVSGLTYAGYAFATLIKDAGLSDHSIPATLLALGTFVLVLSAGWRPLRRTLLNLFPAGITRKLPHPLLSS
jgi:hypothetical protein